MAALLASGDEAMYIVCAVCKDVGGWMWVGGGWLYMCVSECGVLWIPTTTPAIDYF